MTEETGPVSSIKEVVRVAAQFWLNRQQALEILRQVYDAVEGWRVVALTSSVGMDPHDLDDFAPAFEHDQMKLAATLLRQD